MNGRLSLGGRISVPFFGEPSEEFDIKKESSGSERGHAGRTSACTRDLVSLLKRRKERGTDKA